MACVVAFYHDRQGEELSLRLSDLSGIVVNGDELDLLAEVNPLEQPFRYEATVSENLQGWLTAQIFDALGLVYTGQVKVTSDGGTFLIDDPAAAVAVLGDVQVQDVTVGALSNTAIQQMAATRQIHIGIPTLCERHLTAPLIRGDSYTVELNSAIEFARSDFPDLPVGAAATLTARRTEGLPPSTFSLTGSHASIPVRTGTKVVRFEAPSSQTAQWLPGRYEFDVEIQFPNGEQRTFVGPGVFLQVIADLTDASE